MVKMTRVQTQTPGWWDWRCSGVAGSFFADYQSSLVYVVGVFTKAGVAPQLPITRFGGEELALLLHENLDGLNVSCLFSFDSCLLLLPVSRTTLHNFQFHCESRSCRRNAHQNENAAKDTGDQMYRDVLSFIAVVCSPP
eukprot:747254-Hanusia_phi.AAC.3